MLPLAGAVSLVAEWRCVHALHHVTGQPGLAQRVDLTLEVDVLSVESADRICRKITCGAEDHLATVVVVTDHQVVITRDGEATLCLRVRSEEHTSELQSLMRTSSAVFCLKKQRRHTNRYR